MLFKLFHWDTPCNKESELIPLRVWRSSGATPPQAWEKNISCLSHASLGKALHHYICPFVRVRWSWTKRAEITSQQVSRQLLALTQRHRVSSSHTHLGDARQCSFSASWAWPRTWRVVGLAGISYWYFLCERWDCLYHNTGKNVHEFTCQSLVLLQGNVFSVMTHNWEYSLISSL